MAAPYYMHSDKKDLGQSETASEKDHLGSSGSSSCENNNPTQQTDVFTSCFKNAAAGSTDSDNGITSAAQGCDSLRTENVARAAAPAPAPDTNHLNLPSEATTETDMASGRSSNKSVSPCVSNSSGSSKLRSKSKPGKRKPHTTSSSQKNSHRRSSVRSNTSSNSCASESDADNEDEEVDSDDEDDQSWLAPKAIRLSPAVDITNLNFKINPPPKDRPVRIYCDGIFDLFHYGHARCLEQAKKAFPSVYLLVGVCNDKITHARKGKTVMTDLERYESLRHCTWVDEVVTDAPWVLTQEFLDCHKIDYVAHDNIPYATELVDDVYAFVKAQGRFLPTRRTEGISTSDLITRIVRDYDEYLRRNLKRGVSPRELNIGFFKEKRLQVAQTVQEFKEELALELAEWKGELQETYRTWEERSSHYIRSFANLFRTGPGGFVDRIIGITNDASGQLNRIKKAVAFRASGYRRSNGRSSLAQQNSDDSIAGSEDDLESDDGDNGCQNNNSWSESDDDEDDGSKTKDKADVDFGDQSYLKRTNSKKPRRGSTASIKRDQDESSDGDVVTPKSKSSRKRSFSDYQKVTAIPMREKKSVSVLQNSNSKRSKAIISTTNSKTRR